MVSITPMATIVVTISSITFSNRSTGCFVLPCFTLQYTADKINSVA